MRKVAMVVATIALVIGLTGCGSSDNGAKSKGNDNSQSNEKEETKKEFSVGEVVSYKDVDYTVTKVEKSQGQNYDKPADGKEFVIVSLKIVNNSASKITYNAYDWKVANSQGQIDGAAITLVNQNTVLSSGDLAKGGTKEGTLVFEEPKDDSGLYLQYYNTIIDEDYAFKIKLS